MSTQDAATVRDGFPRPFPNTPNNVLEQLRLDGKVVVVTGAAGGIGFAVAEAMAEAGANVALWYNSCVSLPPRILLLPISNHRTVTTRLSKRPRPWPRNTTSRPVLTRSMVGDE